MRVLLPCVLASLGLASAVPASESPAPIPSFRLPLIFNAGLTDPEVHSFLKGAGPDVYFARSEIVFVEPPDSCGDSSVVRMRFEGASPALHLESIDPEPMVASFFLGNIPENWRVDVPMHGGVAYRDAWPGIDALYRSGEERLKADFVVAPGADERLIRLAFEGVSSMRLREDGALVLATPTGQIVEQAPTAWEESPTGKRPLAARFVLLGGNRVGFEVEGRDPRARLVIDPVIDYSSFVGGSAEERIVSMVMTPFEIAVLGSTRSPDFPSLLGDPPDGGGSWDVFRASVDLRAGFGGRVFFFGGSGDDFPAWNEEAWLHGGTTFSPDLPTDASSIADTYSGNGDGFLVRWIGASPEGVTYVGGSGRDEVHVAQDRCGAGRTWSADFRLTVNPTFATPPPPLDATLDGPSDGFLTCISAGMQLSTYYGGSGDDSIDLMTSGSGLGRIIGGWTESPDLPLGPGPSADATLDGVRDGFLSRLLFPEGTVQEGRYVGGSGKDEVTRLLRDGVVGASAIAGTTESADFPVSHPVQVAHGGGADAFLMFIDADWNSVFSTIWGGSGDETIVGGGSAGPGGGSTHSQLFTFAGTTTSPDLSLVRAIQGSLQGPSDGYVVRLNPVSVPHRIEWSTLIGGSGADVIQAATEPSPQGCIGLAGVTDSPDFPSRRAAQPDLASPLDAFVTRVCETDVLRQADPSEQLVEVLERIERIEERLIGLDLDDVRESLARLEGCCGTATTMLGEVLDFADDATARLDAIEDLLARLERSQQGALLREIEDALFERRCVPWLWMPEDMGQLRLAHEHVARRLEEALTLGDPRVNASVAQARLDAVDAEIADGQWQDACKRLSDSLHALTRP